MKGGVTEELTLPCSRCGGALRVTTTRSVAMKNRGTASWTRCRSCKSADGYRRKRIEILAKSEVEVLQNMKRSRQHMVRGMHANQPFFQPWAAPKCLVCRGPSVGEAVSKFRRFPYCKTHGDIARKTIHGTC